jgi:hypothetical protein
MKEGIDNVARFPQLEAGDFERICEFAYFGSFTDPKSDDCKVVEWEMYDKETVSACIAMRISVESAINAPKVEKFTRKIYGGPKRTWKLVRNRSPTKHTALDYKANGWLVGQDIYGEVCVWDDEVEPWKRNVSDVSLSYARLYAFAEKYLIDILKELTLHKLHKYLVALPIYNRTRTAIFDLLLLAYDNENTPDRTNMSEDGVIDELRELVVEFVVVHLPAFRDFSGHRELLVRGGDYTLDLHDKMLI